MSLSGSRSRLLGLTRELSIHWEATCDHWKDAKNLEFRQRYMEQLLLQIEKAVSICDKLDRIIQKARSDCE